jgi:hypothetical protein
MIRLIESFHTIMSFAVRDQYREEIKKHAGMVIRAAERSFRESGDLDDIRKRFELFTGELST